LSGIVRRTIRDNVELAKVTLAWRSPAHFAAGDAELDLLASALSEGKDSVLYRDLVYGRKLAQEVDARQQSHALGSEFVVDATVRPGVDPARVEQALLADIAAMRLRALTAEEIDRARNGYETDFIDRLQSLAERASLLNGYQAEVGDPGFAAQDLARYRRATASDVLAAARDVLSADALVVLTTLPKDAAP
jgi:predicted Zn-dependent peptidase